MNKHNFPHLALGIGLFLFLIVSYGSRINPDGNTYLPLLGLLIMCELAFILTLIGAYISFKQIFSGQNKYTYIAITIACALVSLQFLLRGISLWPG